MEVTVSVSAVTRLEPRTAGLALPTLPQRAPHWLTLSGVSAAAGQGESRGAARGAARPARGERGAAAELKFGFNRTQ